MIGHDHDTQAVSSMLEYLMISGILMVLMIITVITFTSGLIERPVDQLSESEFIDIGNGISTRIVDLFVIAPVSHSGQAISGNITTLFDIPDDIAGREYFVTVTSGSSGDQIIVYRGNIQRKITLAGIGETLGVGGSTSGHGLNKIIYESSGYKLP
ncbi:MAG TPA: hypothetical protein PK445_10400 [Methanolinea sp.]|jgi:uncharacterized membrane protein|nr:hypothetical protein [Methanolinea sp.]HOS83122.1 hypothetical protein [Methanolinea sp.]